jgi:hypothetical protein
MRIRMMGIVAVLALAVAAGFSPAVGRSGRHSGSGGHHHGVVRGGGDGTRGNAVASDERHANDDYVKSAERDEDKLLDSKIKSICRGC